MLVLVDIVKNKYKAAIKCWIILISPWPLYSVLGFRPAKDEPNITLRSLIGVLIERYLVRAYCDMDVCCNLQSAAPSDMEAWLLQAGRSRLFKQRETDWLFRGTFKHSFQIHSFSTTGWIFIYCWPAYIRCRFIARQQVNKINWLAFFIKNTHNAPAHYNLLTKSRPVYLQTQLKIRWNDSRTGLRCAYRCTSTWESLLLTESLWSVETAMVIWIFSA